MLHPKEHRDPGELNDRLSNALEVNATLMAEIVDIAGDSHPRARAKRLRGSSN
jgi:hypothetical protein